MVDFFCGAGGATRGYQQAGFRVLGVDNKPHPDYIGDDFIQADALELMADQSFMARFHARHASPPCQRFTAYRRRGAGVGDNYPDLLAPVRAALQTHGGPYVIENVPGAPLENPLQLCGSSFGLDVRRHRLFETNVAMLAPPCDHTWQKPRFPQATNRKNLRRTVEVGVWRIPLPVQQAAMGIDWMTLEDLTEAIPPAYTEYVGQQLLAHLAAGIAA